MNNFFTSLGRHICFFLNNGLLYPCIFAVIVTVLSFIILNKKEKNNKIQQCILLFFSSFFYVIPPQLAIIARLNEKKSNSLEAIFEGWFIEKLKYSFDFRPIENILMFTPFAIVLCCYFYKFYNFSGKKLILLSGALSMLMSLIIEITQLILCIGTFQISDLVYNTLSGIIGATAMLTIHNIKNHSLKGKRYV